LSGLTIAFFGSSLVSAYWNGAATYYRGMLRALARRGHRVTFYEPDAFDRQKHRDMDDPDWATVVVYPGTDERAALRALEQARGSDLVVKASGVGVYDELLEREVLALRSSCTRVAFWDVDAPATLERVHSDPADPFRELIPGYDLILTYGGGPPVVSAYLALGARECTPVYNALDPDTHFPVPRREQYEADLGFLGNRLPDREARVDDFFLGAAERLPEKKFLLGGSGWEDKALPVNVQRVGHVFTGEHNAFNCTPAAVLNVNRDSMARFGFSPPTRVFEAAGAAACILTDQWEGLELFLEPGREVLAAADGEEVAAHVSALTPKRARALGRAARARVLAEHTYARRAELVETVLGVTPAGVTDELAAGRRRARLVHHFVVGQRSRDDLSVAVA
jgi:spore maturation protein CgeB